VSSTADGQKVSTVLVDDSSDLRALVRRRLEQSGLFDVVAEGGDGDEAISLVIRHEPELLLLDTSMPTCDGLQALPAILAVCPDTTVVMFTGFEEQGLAERARELGAVDVLEKSIPLHELPERLIHALYRSPDRVTPAQPLTLVGGGPVSETTEEQRVLDEHVAQFQDLFDRAAIGMATLTVTGSIVRANEALAELMSCAPYDLVGVDYGQLTSGAGDLLDRGLREITDRGKDLATMEHVVPSAGVPDISPRTVRVTLAPIRDAQRHVLYVFAQVQDISELRAAEVDLRLTEENFRLLVAAVGEYAIFMLDPDGNVVSWNAGAQRIKQYAPSEIIGQSFRVFYPPEDRESGHPEHNLEMARKDGEYAEEGWRIRKDGSQFWASVVISAIYDDTGRHVGFAKVTRDQSQQREHEQERKDLINEQANLLAVTAHELRTPAAVIDGSVSALQAEPSHRAEGDSFLANIRSSTHRLRRLAADLSTVSQLHRGALQHRMGDVTLGAILKSAAARREAAESGVHIDLEVDDSITVWADADRLAQAIDNLLDNAVRHGSAPVTLVGEADDHHVRIRISDAGPGVPERLEPRLFERFVNAGARGGTGLGLYLVREITRAHGGEVDYHPRRPGRTPAFEIRLPRTT
jgi:PAS domain S-box-containing protein